MVGGIMPYIENDPYAIEIAKHVLHSITMEVHANKHTLIVHSFDANDNFIKEDVVELPVFDGSGVILMPSDWPSGWPSGEQLYGYIEKAFYGRLAEEQPWLIGEGSIE